MGGRQRQRRRLHGLPPGTSLGAAHFIPFGVNTWGGIGPHGTALLNRLARKATAAADEAERREADDNIRQNLSLAVMREVWRLLRRRTTVDLDS